MERSDGEEASLRISAPIPRAPRVPKAPKRSEHSRFPLPVPAPRAVLFLLCGPTQWHPPHWSRAGKSVGSRTAWG